MAHELGHLVLGESSHSSEGIMTGTLRKKHFEQANKGKLLFRAEEAQRMRVRCTMNSALAPTLSNLILKSQCGFTTTPQFLQTL